MPENPERIYFDFINSIRFFKSNLYAVEFYFFKIFFIINGALYRDAFKIFL